MLFGAVIAFLAVQVSFSKRSLMAKYNGEIRPLPVGSEKALELNTFSLDSTLEETGGVYLFVIRLLRKGTLKDFIVTLGKTDNLSTVIADNMKNFRQYIPDRILVKYEPSGEKRREIVKAILNMNYGILEPILFFPEDFD